MKNKKTVYMHISAALLGTVWGVVWSLKLLPVFLDLKGEGESIAIFLFAIFLLLGLPIILGGLFNYIAYSAFKQPNKIDRHGQQNMIFHILALNEEREKQSVITYHGIGEGVRDKYDYQFSNDDLSARLAGLWLEGYVVANSNDYRLSQKGKEEMKGKEYGRRI